MSCCSPRYKVQGNSNGGYMEMPCNRRFSLDSFTVEDVLEWNPESPLSYTSNDSSAGVDSRPKRLSLVMDLMRNSDLAPSPAYMQQSMADPATPGGTNGDNMLSSMSIVSPPFTPSESTVNLAEEVQHDPEFVLSEPRLSVSEVQRVQSQLEELPKVVCESRARIPTTSGTEMFLHVYSNNVDNKEHLAIVYGEDIHSKSLFEPRPGETEQDRMTRGAYTGRLYPGRTSSVEPKQSLPAKSGDTLVRIHSECYTGETAWSARCDCGEQLDEAARLMALEGRGCIVYLRQEGRGIGLGEKLKAYNLQDLGADTVQANLMLRHPADARSFAMATAILVDLGLVNIRLLTNNPDKIAAVEGKNNEVHVTQRVPMVPLSWQKKGGFSSKEVDKYLETKVNRMGHLLDLGDRM